MIIWLFVMLFAGLAIGLPVAIAIGGSCIVYLLLSDINIYALVQQMYTTVDSMTLIAIPGFIIAGELMATGGIAKRLVSFCEIFVGRIKGGLAVVNALACMGFGAISGSGVATTLAIGGVMVPEMEKRNYPKAYSAAVSAAGGILGPIIPPSIGLVVYGAATGVSIMSLFKGGITVGIFMGLSIMILCVILGQKLDLPKGTVEKQYTVGKIFGTIIKTLPAFGAPLIILGGIFSGLTTPTEAAVIAIVYACIFGFATRELNGKKLFQILKKAAKNTAAIMLIQAFAGLFSYIVAAERVPYILLNAITALTSNKYIIMLIVTAVLLVLGMFMSGLSIIVIAAPILAPLADSAGINPVHFGLLVSAVLGIGQISPPFGTCLFAGGMISNEPLQKIIRFIWSFIAVYILDVLIIIFVPQLSLLLI